MPVHFHNVNTIWASVLVETLHRLGLTTAIICPGSRSAPLAVAFAQHPAIEAIPILDERSAAFFAIGLARRTGIPVALVCTSGTAGANFYGAVIEAQESRMPLLVLTADRPPELRDCNAGQTVDQQKLYGTFPNWYSELAVPTLDLNLLTYLRQTLIYAWERTLYPVAGVVHLNIPYRDPLAPIPQPDAQAFADQFPPDFFSTVQPNTSSPTVPHSARLTSRIFPTPFPACERGLMIAGLAQPQCPQAYCQLVAQLSQALQVPVLAEGLSPLRNYAKLNPNLISTYDLILRNPELAEKLAPDWVIRVGEMPTSKTLRQWLAQTQPQQWIIDASDRNLDPLHGKTVHLRSSIEQVASHLGTPSEFLGESMTYLSLWQHCETQMRQALDREMAATEVLFEGKVAWLLSQHLPEATPLFIASSTPVRDVEFFWQPGNRAIQPYFNRGANGIDGTLSTALGIAHRNQSSVLLTGDLALLHDSNGFLVSHQLVGHLTIVLINNEGGGIFESLPISGFDPPFEQFFATPQVIDFGALCLAHGVEYERIESWQQLIHRLNPLPTEGIRLLEVPCSRKADAQMRRELFERLKQAAHWR
ncbi:MAG: 2-succinyl-5-enolpyruvyl-6-hydroxy-3-cyclohexene-1-carboxylic-acid synthase [Leptolyngbya sp. IPPAS B-1204]|nr:MAG: 2-succinyl-5-enolpyruvyl-6-hydroxy-3-cyclohexene-1-carboxylic-acid synthase [Leptolyngbya sp. IPPAS B-1204]